LVDLQDLAYDEISLVYPQTVHPNLKQSPEEWKLLLHHQKLTAWMFENDLQ